MKKILEHLGYKTIARTNSVEALKDFKSKPDSFDLVITDMTMPNMTGDMFCKEIMEIRSDIPITHLYLQKHLDILFNELKITQEILSIPRSWGSTRLGLRSLPKLVVKGYNNRG